LSGAEIRHRGRHREENVGHNIRRLQTADPMLEDVIAAGKLKAVAAITTSPAAR
jgi:hypothetical protein